MSLQSRYTILRKITDGGTAEIFLAKQHGAQGFEKMVVLKRIFNTFYSEQPEFSELSFISSEYSFNTFNLEQSEFSELSFISY